MIAATYGKPSRYATIPSFPLRNSTLFREGLLPRGIVGSTLGVAHGLAQHGTIMESVGIRRIQPDGFVKIPHRRWIIAQQVFREASSIQRERKGGLQSNRFRKLRQSLFILALVEQFPAPPVQSLSRGALRRRRRRSYGCGCRCAFGRIGSGDFGSGR